MDSVIANIIILISALALLAAVVITAYSVWHSVRMGKREKTENGVPTRNIMLGAVALPIVVALPTLLFGSLTDACIITSLVLLVVASALVVCGRIRTLSRIRRK